MVGMVLLAATEASANGHARAWTKIGTNPQDQDWFLDIGEENVKAPTIVM